jgi:hypothetical protein
MATALSRKHLDATGCGLPDCNHDHSVLYLHSACHPSRGSRVSYDKRTGLLTVECRQCNKLIAQVKVAE